MPEQIITAPAVNKALTALRSPLLMPVMEGNTLEDEDISHFLSGRLSPDGDESDPADGRKLS
jgi:hypothetical protein